MNVHRLITWDYFILACGILSAASMAYSFYEMVMGFIEMRKTEKEVFKYLKNAEENPPKS